ncbi:hypothetical protein BGZ65_001857 [Modicella reniformis]|uniref:Uncharacterized protein n=1 Tax=Modicella reniformis TaxID=1440133 RepID=A0A9P6M9Y3_9FUNG|nr:hypothetical protein BGZ65_001857 [Modicella reniformis]
MTFSTHDDGDQDDILISTMRSLDLANKKNALAQQEVNAARNNQARLEDKVYDLDQSLAEAHKEIQQLLRTKRDNDREYDQNNAAFERERSLWADREAELSRSLKFATRPLIVQAPKKEREYRELREQKERPSIDIDSAEALPPQIQQQIAENTAANTRALRAHEKMVAELRRQILAMNQDMIERQYTFRLRESELQAEVSQARELNRNLVEENESFQLLLHEKSMNGEFMQTSIMKNTNYDDDLIGTPTSSANNRSTSLADELGKALSQLSSSEELIAQLNALEEEKKTLKEDNKALNLYISKILTRIMEKPQMMALLASDYNPPSTTVTETPVTVNSQGNKNRGSTDNSGSDVDSKKDLGKQPSKQTGRPRSHSVLPFFSWSRSVTPPASGSGKSSNRNSSEDDSTSAGGTTFQEGHSLDDSPRESYSSTENATVIDEQSETEYEYLTTFSQPYSREQLKLQRHASVGGKTADRKRRQTIGAAGSHGRYSSDSSSLPTSRGGRSTAPSKSNLSTLPSMPESQPSMSPMDEVSTIPEDVPDSDSATFVGSPALSISTSVFSNMSTAVATPTTPVVTEGGVLKVFRRISMFGGNNTNGINGTATALSP